MKSGPSFGSASQSSHKFPAAARSGFTGSALSFACMTGHVRSPFAVAAETILINRDIIKVVGRIVSIRCY
jgi:hypothetical protein